MKNTGFHLKKKTVSAFNGIGTLNLASTKMLQKGTLLSKPKQILQEWSSRPENGYGPSNIRDSSSREQNNYNVMR